MQTLEFRTNEVRMLAALFGIVATERDARYYLRGVYADTEVMIATNGHIVAYFKHEQEITHPFIIPARKIPAATIGLEIQYDPDKGEIYSGYSSKQKIGVKQPTVDKIDGTFPAWESAADVPEYNAAEGGDLSCTYVSFQPKLIMPILKALKEDCVLFEQFGGKIRASVRGYEQLKVMIMQCKR